MQYISGGCFQFMGQIKTALEFATSPEKIALAVMLVEAGAQVHSCMCLYLHFFFSSFGLICLHISYCEGSRGSYCLVHRGR